MQRNSFQLFMWMVFIVAIEVWLAIGYRIIFDASNHTGLSHLYSYMVFIPLSVLALLTTRTSESKTPLAIFLFSFVSCIAVWCIYHYNVLVPYEVWLKRGIPLRPF